MKRTVAKVLLGVVWLVLAAAAAGAEELTIDSILTMHRSGAPADVIITRVDSPANTRETRPSESFCYQLNLKIVKGDVHRFASRKPFGPTFLASPSGSPITDLRTTEARRGDPE